MIYPLGAERPLPHYIHHFNYGARVWDIIVGAISRIKKKTHEFIGINSLLEAVGRLERKLEKVRLLVKIPLVVSCDYYFYDLTMT